MDKQLKYGLEKTSGTNQNFIHFQKGFEKIARETSYLKDFAGGVDPTGVITFKAGKKNELANSQSHGLHRGIATAGGVLGGAGVVAPAITGIMGGVTQGLSTQGGIKKKLLGAGKGFIEGLKKPFLSTYHGLAGGRKVMGRNALRGRKHLDYFARQMNVPKEVSIRIPYLDSKRVGRELYGRGIEGLGTLGLSGAISGGSAYLQYKGGIEAGRELANARAQNKNLANQQRIQASIAEH